MTAATLLTGTETGATLAGRTAAVTGAGRGLGLETVRTLLARGANVVANHRSWSEGLDKLAAADERLALVAGDIGEEDTAREIVETAVTRFGGLDVAVHNAAVTRDKPLVSMSVEDWDEVQRVNLRGAFLLSRQAVRLMLRRKAGRLIYLSSISGVAGNAGQANYAASKAGLHGLAKSVAQEYARYNIRSVVVAPGMLNTGLADSIPSKVRDEKEARSLIGICDSYSVAELIAFLASPVGDVVNATLVRADGGMAY